MVYWSDNRDMVIYRRVLNCSGGKEVFEGGGGGMQLGSVDG